MCGQVPGRGLVPRFSIGTLQLSIRCSSIHFLPSRSFPVSAAGVFEGKLAAFDAARSGDLSCAAAPKARHIASDEINAGRFNGRMDALVTPELAMRSRLQNSDQLIGALIRR